jgi:hypothetical protein
MRPFTLATKREKSIDGATLDERKPGRRISDRVSKVILL